MTSDRPRLFCFGVGYSARYLGDDLARRGWTIAGTCRTAETQAALRQKGVEAWLFDRGHPLDDAAEALAGTTHLLSSVPPDADGDPVIDAHAAELAAMTDLRWVGYLSTTGVYGNRDGDWVDERAEPAPSGERGRRRVAAEAAWLSLWEQHGLPVHVFRLAGIYGPGRSALDSVRKGKARRIDKPGQVFSRTHVEDIAQVLAASIERPNPGAVYNVCDDLAAPPQDVIAFAAELLGVAPPPLVPFEEAELSPMARSFYDDNRRVRNDRLKDELGVQLKYPDYKTGLRALMAAASGDQG